MTNIHPRLLLFLVSDFGWAWLLRLRTSLLVVACLGSLWGGSALGQTCPEPWASAPNAYGVVILSGNGASTSGTITQHVNQNAAVGAKMAQPLLGTCAFMAIPLEGFGQTKSTANVSDSLSDSSSGNKFTWVGSGPGNYSGGKPPSASICCRPNTRLELGMPWLELTR